MRTFYLIGLGFLTASFLLFKQLRKRSSSRQIPQFICNPTAVFVLEINPTEQAKIEEQG